MASPRRERKLQSRQATCLRSRAPKAIVGSVSPANHPTMGLSVPIASNRSPVYARRCCDRLAVSRRWAALRFSTATQRRRYNGLPIEGQWEIGRVQSKSNYKRRHASFETLATAGFSPISRCSPPDDIHGESRRCSQLVSATACPSLPSAGRGSVR